MEKQIYLHDEAATLNFAKRMSAHLHAGLFIALQGDLGAGKTTFVRGLLRGLGITERIKSPSYTLLECYESEKFHICHFDLYRLTRAEDLYDIGVESYFNTEHICLVEWPALGAGVLPPADITLHFTVHQTGRMLALTGHTPRGASLVGQLH